MTMESQCFDAKTPNDYTVAIVCAIEFEMSAVRYMLDEEHRRLPSSHGDSNSYILGKLCGHHVVLACLPGNQGKSAAAIVATNLERTFPSIKWRFLPGIGGGVPSEKNDIRLGDVVVSMPEGTYGGVVQYDLGKDTDNGFKLKGFLAAPPSRLRAAVNDMRSDHGINDHKIDEFVTAMLQRGKRGRLNVYRRPAGDSDILFDPDYAHPPDRPSCNSCDTSKLVARPPREWEGSEIHYGLIASGDRVMRSAIKRDLNVRNVGDILCFEMEAAGLATEFPYLVIRGISDYADSHKNDAWQYYAAAAAAAVTKEILTHLEPEAPIETAQAERSPPYGRNDPNRQTSQTFHSNFTGTGVQNVGTGNFTVGGNMHINDGHATRR
jgi:nucleoside phosphorylase